METKFDKIFSETNCPGTQVLQKYLHGELSHAEKHKVEKHLIDCEMCSDELEGLKLLEEQQKTNIVIASINRNIDRQTASVKTKPLYTYRSIAAAVLVLIGISSLFFFYNHPQDTNDLLANKKLPQTEPASNLQEETEQNEATQETQDTTIKLLAQNTLKTTEQQKKEIPAVKEKNISETDDARITDLSVNDEISNNSRIDSTSLAYTETATTTGMSDSDGTTYFSAKSGEVEEEENTAEVLSNQNIIASKEEEANTELLAMNKGRKGKKSQARQAQNNQPATKANEQDKAVATGGAKIDNSQENLLNQAIDDYTTEKYSSAESKLEEIIKNKDFSYFQKAQWYYALTLIKLNKITKAKKLLNEIAGTRKHLYRKEAINKLKELEDIPK